MASSISPITPARVQALVLPVGRVRKHRFQAHVERLRRDAIVRLGDISPDPSSDRNLFSPIAFPDGVILYNFVTTIPPDTHLALAPYETFRSPFVVIGAIDAQDGDLSKDALSQYRARMDAFTQGIPYSILDQLVAFDAPSDMKSRLAKKSILSLPPIADSNSTTTKTVLCDLSSKFLAELSLLAQHVLSLQDIATPQNPAAGAAERPTAGPGYQRASHSSLAANGHVSPDSSIPEEPELRPVTPINEVARTASLAVKGSQERPVSSSGTKAAFGREGSRERRSLQPVNYSQMTERTRNKLKARQSIVVGTLYLHSGRWADALRELSDGSNRARAANDHVWHAKGLESILTTMLLMTWAGVDFSPPSVCSSSFDRINARPRTVSGSGSSFETANANQVKGLQTLSALIPELVHATLNLYARASNLPGEALPQLPFSQSAIRLSYLLALLYNSGGKLSSAALRSLVNGTFASKPQHWKYLGLSQGLKREVASSTFRAYPGNESSAGLTPSDRALILTGMATVLAHAGLHRKHAILVKETLEVLIPGLIQARKVGAAEIGIHPAAGLAALHGLHSDAQSVLPSLTDSAPEAGFHSLLEQLASVFGAIARPKTKQLSMGKDAEQELSEASLPELSEELVLRAFGHSSLKSEILRLCTNFSEALPEFKDVVHFAGALLLAAGPTRSVTTRSASAIRLSRDEQVRLSVKINRTLAVVRSDDTDKLETHYWDPFLVQGIGLGEVMESDLIFSHPQSYLDDVVVSDISSIGKPGSALKVPPTRNASAEDVIVVQDKTRIAVTLQNPFEFELIIERLNLVSSGVKIQQQPASLVVGPRRFQTFNLTVFALEPGTLTLDGCAIKVRGCREAIFKVQKQYGLHVSDGKVKHFGLDFLAAQSDVEAEQAAGEDEPSTKTAPRAETKSFSATVISTQPLLTVSSNTLSQSIITILEGEKLRFSLTVRNMSKSIPVTFSRLSFSHPLRESQMDTGKGLQGRAELHELEWLTLHRQPFTWVKESDEDTRIEPGASRTFSIDVYGRIGSTGGTAILDYCFLDRDTLKPGSRLFTRAISLPFSVTVNPSVLLQRLDVLPVSLARTPAVANDSKDRVSATGTGEKTSHLLLLDLKNASSHPLSVNVRSTSTASNATVQPTHTARISLPLPRILIPHVHAPIPPLGYLKERQFVVSREGPRPDAMTDKQVLANFWTRLALLDSLQADWTSLETPKSGQVDLRNLRLEARMGEIVRLDPVALSVELTDIETGPIQMEQPVKIRIRLRNRSGRKLVGKIKCSIGLVGERIETSRNVVHQGKLDRHFRALEDGASIEMHLIVCVLATGRWEVRVRASEEDGSALGQARRGLHIIDDSSDNS